MFSVALIRELDKVEPELKSVLLYILDEIEQNREASVTKTEFNELKEIVRELGQTTKELAKAQDRTERRIDELAQAQKQTELRLNELAQAQKQTELRLDELAQALKQTAKEVAVLSRTLDGTKSQVGGLSKSIAYALENEAYRKLPAYLKTHFQLDITESFVRSFIGGEEINIFAKASRNGEETIIVGETVLRLDDRSKMGKLETKVNTVKKQYNQSIIPMIITHIAHPDILEKARKEGVIVVQSFEWG